MNVTRGSRRLEPAGAGFIRLFLKTEADIQLMNVSNMHKCIQLKKLYNAI